MSEFKPYITSDGSVGLYSSQFNDIYHSADGALTEAYEKFIYPINMEYLLQNEQIKILDICYGIGYNSKSFLNFIFNLKNFSKNKSYRNYIESIHTDNNLKKKNNKYNDTIYVDNIFSKISIHAVDLDGKLIYLSPFIKSNIKFRNRSLKSKKKCVNKLKNDKFFKINKLINFLIFSKIFDNSSKINNDAVYNDLISELYTCNNHKYFDSFLRGLFKSFYYKKKYKHLGNHLISNLHNIYYKYISKWYKWRMKTYKLADVEFKYSINDARDVIKKDKNTYNLIFLDAFTPAKCPCLWSYDFFCELYSHLDKNGMLLTYSSAAPVRNAMRAAGFEIGYVYNKRLNKNIGTIATNNKSLIEFPLSEYDLGLLNSRAGIFYRDKNLNALNEAINAARDLEVKKSDIISTTQYIKLYKKKN